MKIVAPDDAAIRDGTVMLGSMLTSSAKCILILVERLVVHDFEVTPSRDSVLLA
jgi:hypothetical protein